MNENKNEIGKKEGERKSYHNKILTIGSQLTSDYKMNIDNNLNDKKTDNKD